MSSNINVNYKKTPFVCYFCNREIRTETETGHIAVCSSVLVPCPNKCGVYTPRVDLVDHVEKCPNQTRKSQYYQRSNQDLASSLNYSTLSIADSPRDQSQGINNNITTQNLMSEVKSLQNRCSILEQYLSRLSEFHKSKTFVESEEIDRLTVHNRLLEEWRDIMNVKLDNLRQKIMEQERSKSETLGHWNHLRQNLVVFEKLKIDVNNIKEDISTERAKTKLKEAEFSQEIITLVQLIDKQHSFMVETFGKNDENMTQINTRITELEKEINQLKAKFVEFNFDLKALARVATENEEKIEIQAREFENIKKELRQMKVDIEIAEENPDNNLPIGRYLWKVVNVHARMKSAKEIGTILKSPVFYSHQFGYKIRVHLFLNGLNKWKDRYSLICLQVIKGEYDMALKWPCNIEGTITLRDTVNFENPKHVSKFISAKRNHSEEESEDPQESSPSFIFIPHRTLMKPSYLRADTLFLDININNNRSLSQETDL